MILSFPSPMMRFDVVKNVPKGSRAGGAHFMTTLVLVTAPIDLKLEDCLWVDLRSGKVEVVERGGIVIWRAGWMN